MNATTRSMIQRSCMLLLALFALSLLVSRPAASLAQTTPATPKMVGYFASWNVYQRGYRVQHIARSGSASRLTHINYAFSNVIPDTSGGQIKCKLHDADSDYMRGWTAEESVNGVEVPWGARLRGNFQQLKMLKLLYPNIKVMISLGGWSLSPYFSDMALTAASRTAFVQSCVDLFIKGDLPLDPREGSNAGGPGAAAGVFDGIDVDWEFPGVCGQSCESFPAGQEYVCPAGSTHCIARPADTQNFTLLLQEFRRQLNIVGQETNKRYLLTIATPASPRHYVKIQLGQIHQYVDFINLMSYDLHGAWDANTNFQSALYPSAADPDRAAGLTVHQAAQGYLQRGVPRAKLVLGVPFYGRGWADVGSVNNGLYQPGPADVPGTWENGIEDFKVLKARLKQGAFTRYYNTTTRNAWLYNANTRIFWTYDDAQTQREKALYVKAQQLGGVMFWEISGDTADGQLVSALYGALNW
jgi:chitinase